MSGFNILNLILPPEEKIFYELFERSCDICHDSALLLLKLVDEEGKESPELFNQVKQLRQESNIVSKEILNRLNKTFITPIDREDIQYISSKLNKINKKITKTYSNYLVYKISAYNQQIRTHVALLVDATNELKTTLGYLKKVSNIKEMIASSQRLDEIENKGDELFLKDLEELFSGAYDALTAIKLKDLYQSIESSLNNCSNVSDEVVRIAYKHT